MLYVSVFPETTFLGIKQYILQKSVILCRQIDILSKDREPLSETIGILKEERTLNKFKEKLKGGFKKRIIAAIVAAAVIITSVNLTDIAGDDNKDVSSKNRELSSFAEEVAELTAEDTYEGNSKYQTKRLIVTSDSDSFDTFGAAETINYGDIFVLAYETEEACNEARKNLLNEDGIKSVEIDAVMEIETKKVSDKDIEKAMQISSYSDNDKKAHETLDGYDSFNINHFEEDVENNVDNYIKEKKLQQKNDVIVAIIDSGADRSAISDNRFIDSQKNFSGEGEADDITDKNGHGSQMAEIISSQTGDNVKIMPVKVANKDGKCSILSAYLGVKYAAENGADVINISMNTMASAKSEILENAIKEASKKGITVSVSAGNDMDNAKFYTPSNIREAFVISATDQNTTLAGYSNFGETVDYASCGIYKESEGTSIAAANFAASAAKLKSAGVKDIESIMDKITGYSSEKDKNTESNFFHGRGYIGDKRIVVKPEDDKKAKSMIIGSAPSLADIRNLEDGKWKELTREELEYYIKNSSYISIGAFLTSLEKEDLKSVVNNSEELRKKMLVFKDGKLYKKMLKYEDAMRIYSERLETLSVSEARPLNVYGSQPVLIGGFNEETDGHLSDLSRLSYFSIDSITLKGNTSDTDYFNSSAISYDISFAGPTNHSDISAVTISDPASNTYLGETDNSDIQKYAAVYGSFNATIKEHYKTNSSHKTLRNTKKTDFNGTSWTPSYNADVRLNFHNNGSDSDTTNWTVTDPRSKTCYWQCNVSNLGITMYFRNTNENPTRTFYETRAGQIPGTRLFFGIDRPQYTVTVQAKSGDGSIKGISPASTTVRRGEDIDLTNAFTIDVNDGYDKDKLVFTPSSAYTSVTENKTTTVYAQPKIYDFNYYPGDTSGMTREDEHGNGPYVDKIEFNSAFKWQSSNLFHGHYNLTFKAIPLSTETDKPSVGENESFGIRQFERNQQEWEPSEEEYQGNIIQIDRYNPSSLKPVDFSMTNDTKSGQVNTLVSSWKWNNQNYGVSVDGTNNYAGNRDIYANWNNGVYPDLPKPSMTGFTFNGWHTERSYDPIMRGFNGSGDKVEKGNSYNLKNDQTLYGNWSRNEYTVTYKYGDNGGYVSNAKNADGTNKTEVKETFKYDWPIEIPMNAEKSTDNGTYTQEQIENNQAPGVYSRDNPDGWEFIGWSECKHAKSGESGICTECGNSKKIYGIVENHGQRAYKKKENGEYIKDAFGRYVSTSFWESSVSPKPEDYITDEVYMPAHDITLYAIYRKTLKFTASCSKGILSDPEKTMLAENVTKTLYGNEYGIDITIPQIKPAYFGLSIEGSGKYEQWSNVGWSEETTADGARVYTDNDCKTESSLPKKTIYKNYALYAVYNREINAYFVSYESDAEELEKGNYQKTQAKTGTQWVNSYNIENTTEVDITVPAAYEYKVDLQNGIWSQNSWILDKYAKQYNESTKFIQDADILKERGKFETSKYTEEEYLENKEKQSSALTANGSKIKIRCNETYYALYDRNIHISYTHYNNNERVENEKQEVRQYAISIDTNYSNPPVILKQIGNYSEWPEECYWSSSNTSVIKSYNNQDADKSVVININKNLNLYAVYQREINANFIFYENEQINSSPVQKTITKKGLQRGNAYDFDSTKENVKFNDPGISGVIDDRGYAWTGQFWTMSSSDSKNASNDIENDPFTITDTTSFYAVYKTLYTASFTSIRGSLNSTRTKEDFAWFNANDITKKDNPVVTAPDQEVCSINSKTWTKLGWTTSTNTTDLTGERTPFGKDTSVTLTGNTSFYGIYDTKLNINFVDYDGTTKKTSQETATQMVNSYDRHPSSPVLTAPELHTCTLDGKTWNPVGWSPAIDTFTADKQAGDTISVDNAGTFYGIYSTDVTLNFVTYRTSENPPAQTGRVYMNSANSTNRKKASAAITNPRNSDVWTGIGWTTSTNKGASVEVSTGNTFEYDRDTTLYGLYKRDIYIKYKLNDGTDNEYGGDPQKAEIQVNAYDTSKISPAMATIISGSPSRGSFQFMGAWGNTSMNPTVKYIPGSVHAFSEDTTLYAQWELPTIDKTITIQWEDGNNLNKTRPAAVWLELYRDGALVTSHLVSSADNVAKPSGNKIIGAEGTKVDTSGTGNEFKYTYKELQKYSPEDGHAYSYTVKEKPVESLVNGLMYTISYPSSDVVKNILANSEGIQMNVEINWDDGLNAWHIRPSMVYVSLIRTDPDTHEEKVVKTVSIKPAPEAETQVYSFNNVEVMNASKHLYTYRVKLNPIPGYSTTYGELTDRDGVPTFPVYNVCTGLPTLYGENYIIFSADAFCSNGNMATGKDYLNIDATDYDPVLITLRQVHKVWSGTGADATESYENNKYMHNDVNNTDISYNVIVSPHVDTKLVKIPYGRYELDMHENALFDLTKFNAANSEKINASLDTINGKQYVTFSAKHSSGAIAKLHANLLIANWRGYTTIQSRYQPLDHTVVTARMPGNYDNFGYLKKTWNLMKIDKEIILNDDGTIFKMNPDFGIDGELVMDKKVQKLEAEAFSGQKNLVKLTLPNNLKRVDGNAFKNCSQLRIVTYLGVQYTTNSALKEAFRRNGVTFEESAFEGVALGY